MSNEIADRYRSRFEEAARQDSDGLTVAVVQGQPYLLPTKSHAVWFTMRHCDLDSEAIVLAENFLNF